MPRDLPSGVVTLLFTDIEGSSRLLEAAGAAYGDLLAAHRRLLREAWAAYAGSEVDTQGDSFFVAFADPEAALRAAQAAITALAGHDWGPHGPVAVRIGVHTGTPALGEEGYWGADVHYGARVGAAAHGGQVLVSAATAALVADRPGLPLVSLGEHTVKDFPHPRELFQLVVAGRGPDAFPPVRTRSRGRHPLPEPATALLGREEDLRTVATLVAQHRLVTLVGPGGSGKTRLALEAARAADAGDVWFVALESVADPVEVVPAIAHALGLPDDRDPATALADYLADRSALLVLDNLEQVVAAAPRIAALLAEAPDLRVLATSQVPLRVRAEHVLRIDPLDQEPALRLLSERAAAAGVDLAAEDPAALAALVDRLERMPLAIELAASRLAVISPEALMRQLDHRLDAVGSGARDLPGRQRSLRAVLDWTCSLLDPAERAALSALAAFGADVDPELADDAHPGTLDALPTLADAGLVTLGRDRRVRLRPPVRLYATGLVEPERFAELQRQVVRALARLGECFAGRWLVEATAGRRALSREEGNILPALEWARRHDPEGHADLVAATGWWMTHQHLGTVGRAHVDHALAQTVDARLRARLLQTRGVLGLDDNDPRACLAAAGAWAELGEVDRQVVCLAYGSNLLVHEGTDPDRAVAVAEEAVALADGRRGADPWLWWMASDMLAQALSFAGRREEAWALIRELDGLCDDDPWRRFFSLTLAADVHALDGAPLEALPLYAACVDLIGQVGSTSGQLLQAASIAHCLAAAGRAESAARALALCEYVDRELGHPLPGLLGPFLAQTRAEVDPGRLSAARAAVGEVAVEAALAAAARLGEPDQPPTAGAWS